MAKEDQQGGKMKLRNKKTGEIINSKDLLTDEFIIDLFSKDFNYFNSKLNKIQEEWQDYEEPKFIRDYWFIDSCGSINKQDADILGANRREIGNYFETKEEAKKAVEKLKAFKRLIDKGFKFIGVRGIGKVIDFDIPEPYNHVGFDEYVASKDEKEFYDDLLFLFGGEE